MLTPTESLTTMIVPMTPVLMGIATIRGALMSTTLAEQIFDTALHYARSPRVSLRRIPVDMVRNYPYSEYEDCSLKGIDVSTLDQGYVLVPQDDTLFGMFGNTVPELLAALSYSSVGETYRFELDPFTGEEDKDLLVRLYEISRIRRVNLTISILDGYSFTVKFSVASSDPKVVKLGSNFQYRLRVDYASGTTSWVRE